MTDQQTEKIFEEISTVRRGTDKMSDQLDMLLV